MISRALIHGKRRAEEMREVSRTGGSDFALRRTGKIADGWMTHSVSPDGFRRSWDAVLAAAKEAGRDPDGMDNVLCYHVNIQPDADSALADAKRYLDLYYNADYTRERLAAWGAYGTPAEVIAQLRGFLGSGCNRITFRLATTGDAMTQFPRLTEKVLPNVAAWPPFSPS